MRGGGARSRIAPRVFSTNSGEEFPKTSGEALNRRHRPVPIANELRRGIKKVSWASIAAIPLQGGRAAQAFARDARLVLHFQRDGPASAGTLREVLRLREAPCGSWAVHL